MPGFPPVHGGGLVRYAIDLAVQEARMGQEVLLLIPGRLYKNRDHETRIREAVSRHGITTAHGRIRIFEIDHPQPVPMGNGILDIQAYTKACRGEPYGVFLRQEEPDIIHIHTFMGLHREFLEEAGKSRIPVVFTTHDYFGLCPAGNLFLAGGICRDQEWKRCTECCQNAYSRRKLCLVHTKAYRRYRKCRRLVRAVHSETACRLQRGMIRTAWQAADGRPLAGEGRNSADSSGRKDYSRLRKYYRDMFRMVTMFHFNSSIAKEMYCSRLGELTGEIVPVSHRGIRDRRRRRSYAHRLRLGYFGNWSEHKGFFHLLHACKSLYQEGRRDFKLHVYSDSDRRGECFVRNHPVFGWKELGEVLDTVDILIVPSLWAETFGLVVIEALSCGVPAVISENTGAKDILMRYPGTGFLYDGTRTGLEQILRQIYDCRELLEQANERILHMDYDFSYAGHVRKMMDLYRELVQ